MSNHLSRAASAVLCAVLLGIPAPIGEGRANHFPAPAGAADDQAAAQQAPPIRTTTRLVQVSVIVRDKNGNPVDNLTKDDFVVSDKGQAQKISTFSMERLTRATETKTAPTTVTNTFSNRLEEAGAPTSVTVILLDGLNTRILDQTYARDEILKFLGQLQPHDRVALYALSGSGLRVLHDFTSDATPLIEALNRYRTRDPSAVRAANPALAQNIPGTRQSDTSATAPGGSGGMAAADYDFDTWLNSVLQQTADFYMVNRVRETADAMIAIANHVARLPGRKNLVWVSGSFPFDYGLDRVYGPISGTRSPSDRQIFVDEIRRVARAMNNANVAVYPVDARGLVGPYGETVAAAVGFIPREAVGRGPVGPRATLGNVYAGIDTMKDMAERTGGRAFYNTNDIKEGIRKAVADSEVTYTLAFYPNHNNWDGSFRKIKVEVKRGGLDVRYRLGYFAMPDEQLTAKQKEDLIQQIAAGPLDATELGVTVRPALDSSTTPGGVVAQINVSGKDLSLELKNGAWEGQLQLLMVQRMEDGRVVGSSGEVLDIAIPDQAIERVRSDGLNITRKMQLAARVDELRVAVRDGSSGAVGSVTVPMKRLMK